MADGVLYASGWGYLHALNARTGEPIWSTDHCCVYVLQDGVLYMADQGTILAYGAPRNHGHLSAGGNTRSGAHGVSHPEGNTHSGAHGVPHPDANNGTRAGNPHHSGPCGRAEQSAR